MLYIFNPKANKGRAKKYKNKIIQYLEELDIIGNFVELKKLKNIRSIINKAEKDGIKTIVAIGGDGVVNEIIQEIASKDMVLGIVPLGETNLLANIMGIDSWQLGCEVLVKRKIFNIDLGKANDKYFTSTLEIDEKARKKGLVSRIFSSKTEKRYFPISMTINNNNDSDKLKLQTNIASLLISTIPIPPPRNIDREEELTNEELNIFIKSKPMTDTNSKKEYTRTDEVTILKGENIYLDAKSALPVKIDGEEIEKTPLTIKIIPKALSIIVPRKNG